MLERCGGCEFKPHLGQIPFVVGTKQQHLVKVSFHSLVAEKASNLNLEFEGDMFLKGSIMLSLSTAKYTQMSIFCFHAKPVVHQSL